MSARLLLKLFAALLPLCQQLGLQINESGRLVTVGKQQMFLNCTRKGPGPTVVLEAGTGDTSQVWAAVQKHVQTVFQCELPNLPYGGQILPLASLAALRNPVTGQSTIVR